MKKFSVEDRLLESGKLMKAKQEIREVLRKDVVKPILNKHSMKIMRNNYDKTKLYDQHNYQKSKSSP
jgi:hypothetical protein